MMAILISLAAWTMLGGVVAWATGSLAVKQWLYQLFIAVDQLLNVLLTPLHRGAWADETMSSRTYRMWDDHKPWGVVMKPVIDFLFAWQGPGHCYNAFVKERNRMHSPPEER